MFKHLSMFVGISTSGAGIKCLVSAWPLVDTQFTHCCTTFQLIKASDAQGRKKRERNIYKTCINFVKMNKSSIVMFWLHFTSSTCPELFCRKCSSSSASGSLHWSTSVSIYLCLNRQNHYSQCLMPESITWAPDMWVQLLSVSLNHSSVRPPLTTITHTLNMY